MADLVGKAAEEDDTFWNSEVWGEDESDDSFSEEEVKPDVFDEDFNDSEGDDDDDDDDDSVDKKRNAENDTSRVRFIIKLCSYNMQVTIYIK